ncbi:MAG: hypothetical protein ABSA52_17080 [Candidatus Binatia bacterium]
MESLEILVVAAAISGFFHKLYVPQRAPAGQIRGNDRLPDLAVSNLFDMVKDGTIDWLLGFRLPKTGTEP